MKYDLILFDADATLFDFEKAELNGLVSVFSSINIDINNEMLNAYHEINKVLWTSFQEMKIDIKNLNHERFRQLFERFNIPEDYINFSEEYLNYLGKQSILMQGAEEIVKYLSDKCILAIITNGIAKVQHMRIDNSIINKYINNLIISEEINSSKPNNEIFEYAIQKCGYSNKEKIIIIGDSLSSDILGGQRFGIDTCWYNPENKINVDEDIKPTYTINQLNEIRNIINA